MLKDNSLPYGCCCRRHYFLLESSHGPESPMPSDSHLWRQNLGTGSMDLVTCSHPRHIELSAQSQALPAWPDTNVQGASPSIS